MSRQSKSFTCIETASTMHIEHAFIYYIFISCPAKVHVDFQSRPRISTSQVSSNADTGCEKGKAYRSF